MSIGVALAERGWIPDSLVRKGIRRLDAQRLHEEESISGGDSRRRLQQFAQSLSRGPLAVATDKANEQHYEVPAPFFERVLGTHLKYSSCFYETGSESLSEAEEKALQLTCEHAELSDGQDVLELGCGWGSLALWMAQRYPKSRICTVSNSHSQRAFITGRIKALGLSNLEVKTSNINDFEIDRTFDRVVSVEMFEHLRNYEDLFSRIARWLKPEGKLFCHIFCHRRFAYLFECTGEDDWMARHFFTGGMMPAENLFLQFQKDLKFENKWWWNGSHYARTAEHWLQNLDQKRNEVLPILQSTYGPENAALWFQRWRIFFMACAELFAYGGGEEWGVSHYLFKKA